jgi:nitrogenase molybdenum-iron protein alpha/beta subunit
MKKTADGEKEKSGALQQRSCSLYGMASCLLQTGGKFAVVVHGPVDCTNVFMRHVPDGSLSPAARPDFSSDRFFSSALSETDVILGRSEEKLAACIEEVLGLGEAEILFVLGTCLSQIIGDDIRKVAAKLSGKTGTRIVAVPTSGLELRHQPEIADSFERAMLSCVAGRQRKIRGSVALAGLSLGDAGLEEVKAGLRAAGLKLLVALREFSTIDEWRLAARARLVAVVDAGAHRSMISVLGKGRAAACIGLPPPFGTKATLAFYDAIFKGAGKAAAAEKIFAAPLKAAAEAAGKAAKFLGGKRVAYETGSALGFRPGQHALEGLAPAAVFDELGMQVELIVQGVDSPENRSRIERQLDGTGLHRTFRIFQDPGRLPDLLGEGGYDLVYCSDGRREQALASCIPFLPLGSLEPLLGGMRKNAALVEAAAGSLFSRRYGRYRG